MINSQESIEFFVSLKRSLSAARFAGYHTGGSELDAFAKYLWNIQLCEALCSCFQLLEVAFRNKVHSQIGIAIKNPAWILNQHGIVYAEEQEAIQKAKVSLRMAGSPMTENFLVSGMKFGF